MKRFQNKYRIQSCRKPNWDYSANGMYFLTIVTQDRVCNLGEIQHEKMHLSNFGDIVETEWCKSFEIRNELYLDEYIIMPNHIHAIVILKNGNGNGTHVETHGRASLQPTSSNEPTSSNKPMPNNYPTHINNLSSIIKPNKPVRLPKSISSFIAGFKSAVNTKIDDYIDEKKLLISKYNKKNHFFQPNYHDHIIRNEWEYWNIKNYIIYNPKNWENDKLNIPPLPPPLN